MALVVVLASPLGAQAPGDDTGVGRAASLITAASLARQVVVLTADSLWGRATPSGALDRTAQYVQSVLRQDSAAEAGIYTYAVPGRRVRLNLSQSSVSVGQLLRARELPVLTENGQAAVRNVLAPFATSAYFAVPLVPELNLHKPRVFAPTVLLLTGRLTEAYLRQADVAGKSVIYLPPADLDSAARRAVFDQLYDAALGAVVLERDSVRFAGHAARFAQPLELADAFLGQEWGTETPRPWVVEVRSRAVENLLTGIGVDVAQADTAKIPAVRSLPDFRIWHTNVFDTTDTAAATAPLVAKFLVGSDPALRRHCLVVAAPLDQREAYAHGADSAARRGDPSTLSLAGFLELVRAFQALPARPKRSVIFLATSGGGAGQLFWGSHFFFYHQDPCDVLSLTIDFGVGLGTGNGSGTQSTDEAKNLAVFAGLDEVVFAPPLASVAAAHPELNLTVVDGGTVTEPRSDAYALLRRGPPSLLLQGGTADDGARGPGPFDSERAARLLRLAFYVSVAAADGTVPPRMSPNGRQRVAEMRVPGR